MRVERRQIKKREPWKKETLRQKGVDRSKREGAASPSSFNERTERGTGIKGFGAAKTRGTGRDKGLVETLR